MSDGMTRAQVGRRLGMSRMTVAAIETRALAKLALALGAPPPKAPASLRRYVAEGLRSKRCSACGERGHNRLTCSDARKASP